MKLFCVFLVASVVLRTSLLVSAGISPNETTSPYYVLGVSRDASQEEIKRHYRALCLKYHPDKNVNRSAAERRKCEERFKQVQKANSQIGDPESRRNYDSRTSFASAFGASSPTSSQSSQSFHDNLYDDIFREFQRYSFGRTTSGTPSFFGGGFSATDMFGRRHYSNPVRSGSFLKSVFVQRVHVPLQDLYTGKRNVEFVLNTNLWNRLVAAFRGGVAYIYLYQAFLYAIPLLRVSRWVAAFFGFFIFQKLLPQPSSKLYHADIQAGYKSGTKLIFNKETEPGFEVIFELCEDNSHARFCRIGNDLHTKATISYRQAKEGCTIEIDSLNDAEPPIPIEIPAGRIHRSGQTITLAGQGWPVRKSNNKKGDLIIHVKLTAQAWAKGRRTTTS